MSSPINPASNDEKEKILVSALQEMRIKYQNINTDYNTLGTKIFTLIATELVIATFIFTFKLAEDKPLFALTTLSTTIFFSIGMAAIIIAIGLLFWSVTSNKWADPAEKKELKKLNYKTHIDFLQETKDDYIEAYEFCIGRYGQRRIAFDASVIMFVLGAIILMVIKIGG